MQSRTSAAFLSKHGNLLHKVAFTLQGLSRPVRLGFCAAAAGELYFSMLAPFFPIAARDIGVSQQATGFIFGAMPLGQLLTAPFVPRLRERCGLHAHLIVLAAMVASGALGVGFALTGSIVDPAAFIAATSAIRFGQGATVTVLEVTVFSLLVRSMTSAEAGEANGVLVALRGVAMLSGPVVGGVLYQAAGFACPFLMGSAIFGLLAAALACSPGFADADASAAAPQTPPVKREPPRPRSGRSEAFGDRAGDVLSVRTFRVVMAFQGAIMLTISFLQPSWQAHHHHAGSTELAIAPMR